MSASAFVGSIPQEYDLGLGPVIFADYAAEMARLVAAHKPTRILETAAGTGYVTRQLHAMMPDVPIVATDLNPPMLDVARAKFADADGVTFEAADATALPYDDEAFDMVVCQFGIMFFPDKAKGYREAFRVLKPGGRYLFSVWDSHRYNAFGRIAHETVGQLIPDNPPRFYEVPFGSAALDPIKDGLAEAGFRDLAIRVMPLDKVVPDIARFAHALVFGNPMLDEIRARGVDPAKVEAAIEAALRVQLAGGPLPLQTIVFDAGKP